MDRSARERGVTSMLACRPTAPRPVECVDGGPERPAPDPRYVRVCLSDRKPAAATYLGLEGYAIVSRETGFLMGWYAYARDCTSETVETCRRSRRRGTESVYLAGSPVGDVVAPTLMPGVSHPISYTDDTMERVRN